MKLSCGLIRIIAVPAFDYFRFFPLLSLESFQFLLYFCLGHGDVCFQKLIGFERKLKLLSGKFLFCVVV